MQKSLNVKNETDARKRIHDIEIIGSTDLFQLLCKASSKSQGWMKSAKAMQVSGGCIVQVTTQQKNPDGSYAVAEALTFAPGVQVVEDVNGGRKLE